MFKEITEIKEIVAAKQPKIGLEVIAEKMAKEGKLNLRVEDLDQPIVLAAK